MVSTQRMVAVVNAPNYPFAVSFLAFFYMLFEVKTEVFGKVTQKSALIT
jgi:hypothetical protein